MGLPYEQARRLSHSFSLIPTGTKPVHDENRCRVKLHLWVHKIIGASFFCTKRFEETDLKRSAINFMRASAIFLYLFHLKMVGLSTQHEC